MVAATPSCAEAGAYLATCCYATDARTTAMHTREICVPAKVGTTFPGGSSCEPKVLSLIQFQAVRVRIDSIHLMPFELHKSIDMCKKDPHDRCRWWCRQTRTKA
jgi:hypothetical protein